MPRFGRVALGMTVLMVASCNNQGAPPRAVAPASVSPRAHTKEVDEAATKCALISSCAHPHDPPRIREPSLCAESWLLRGAEPCLRQATTCAAIDLCLHAGNDAAAASFCAAHPGTLSACDEKNRFISCGEDLVTPLDCTALGATCGEIRPAGGLIVRGCVSRALCPSNAPDARCEGKMGVLSCHEGTVERVTCSAGEHCEEHRDADGDQTAMCEVSGDSHCDDVGGSSCRGTELVECLPHGHFGAARTSDCAAAGMVCRGRGRQAGCVVAGPSSCTPGPARCEGDHLVFCAAGAEVKVACASVGLGRCDASGHGPEAACTGR